MDKKKQKGETTSLVDNIIAILTIVIVVLIIYNVAILLDVSTIESANDNELQCITENSVMVALKSCGACNKQKEFFGDKIEYLNVIYCEDNKQFCIDGEIVAVPTWIIKNKKYVGLQSIEQLKELSGC